MKIKTITCHGVYNHGASLQEYALLHYLNNNGFEAEAINYQPKYLAENYSYFGVANQKFKKTILLKAFYILAKFPSRFYDRNRRKKFDEFEKKYIPSTKQQYVDNEQLKINLPEADVYICGSDQIWNSLFQNGKDPAFYLDFVPDNKRKVSYAPSFAIDKIPEGWEQFVKEKVNRLDYVSVREKSGQKLLEDLGIESVEHVLDPVFLLSKNEWEKYFIKNNQSEAYILVYDFENNPVIRDFALQLKEKNGWRIIALSKRIKYADKIYWSIGPDKFLNLLYHSQFVLANSFHANAFSVIFEKQFLIFNRQTKINTRMRDFLNDIGMSDRLVSEMDKKILNNKIDYVTAKELLEEKIQKSKSFLQKSLGNERMA